MNLRGEEEEFVMDLSVFRSLDYSQMFVFLLKIFLTFTKMKKMCDH